MMRSSSTVSALPHLCSNKKRELLRVLCFTFLSLIFFILMLQFFKCIITDQVCGNGAVCKQQPPEDAPKSQEDYGSRNQIFYETDDANFS
jgi:hypothetical protein